MEVRTPSSWDTEWGRTRVWTIAPSGSPNEHVVESFKCCRRCGFVKWGAFRVFEESLVAFISNTRVKKVKKNVIFLIFLFSTKIKKIWTHQDAGPRAHQNHWFFGIGVLHKNQKIWTHQIALPGAHQNHWFLGFIHDLAHCTTRKWTVSTFLKNINRTAWSAPKDLFFQHFQLFEKKKVFLVDLEEITLPTRF